MKYYFFLEPAEIFHYVSTIGQYAADGCTSNLAKDVLWHEVYIALLVSKLIPEQSLSTLLQAMVILIKGYYKLSEEDAYAAYEKQELPTNILS